MQNDLPYVQHPLEVPVKISRIVTIHYFEYTKDYQYPGERHDFWEVMYLDRGSAYVTCGDCEHLLSQGELILLPPNVRHTIRADARQPSNVFITSFASDSPALCPAAGRVLSLPSDSRALIRSMLQEGARAFELPMRDRYSLQVRADAPFGSQQLYQLRLEELMLRVIRIARESEAALPSAAPPQKSRFDEQIAGDVMRLLKANVRGHLTLADITAELGYGKTYLSLIFKKVYGTSIMLRYTELKIEEAKYLIRSGTLSISEISSLLCFSSPQYFSRRFRELTHMSPKQYESSVKDAWATLPFDVFPASDGQHSMVEEDRQTE